MPDSTNVIVIVADDLGWFDLGCYNQGMMGAQTPNIDRIAAEVPASPTPMRRRAAPGRAP